MELKGIDISTWQGKNVDFNKVKSSGIQFAILRAGFGREVRQKDNTFESNYSKAKAVGMPVGVYWYSYAISVEDAKKEANACLQCIKGKQFEYPIYFDIEDPSMVKLGKSTLTQICIAFCETIEKAGYFVGIYSNPNWLQNYLDYNQLKKYTLWLAHWVSNPSKAYVYDMWQYSSNGSVNGISGRVDMDICYKDFPTIIKDAGLNGFNKSEPSTPSKPSHKDVNDSVVNAVINGAYGNGAERKQKLESEGYNYSEVQAAVNAKLSGTSVTKKSVNDAVVNAVIRGDYGSGAARKQKLESEGYNYSEVQSAVNKKLGLSAPSKKPVTDAVVNAVIRGDYGNGAARTQKLTAEGYDAAAVQAAVNKKLG